MVVYFTSDTHFSQDRTFNLSLRTMYFKDLNEMDETIIKKWNDKVNEDDIVFHLGDFGNYEIAKRLNGKIILLFGNYEYSNNYKPTDEQLNYFYKVYKEKFILFNDNSGIISDDMLLMHEPENKKLCEEDIFYLFGHIHEKQKVKKRGLNVGMDVHNFEVVDLNRIKFYKDAIENIYDDNCFVNY